MDLKERIVRTSSELFYENGIKRVTMDIIAETLGISKRTLYEVFKDKNDLVGECFAFALRCNEKKRIEIRKKATNVLEEMLMFYMEGIVNVRKCNRNFISDLRKYHPEVFERFRKHREHIFREDVVIALDTGMLEGYVRPDVNSEIIAIMIKEQLYTIEAEIPELRSFNLTEIYETLFMSFARGIATPKGLKVIDDLIEKNSKQLSKSKSKVYNR